MLGLEGLSQNRKQETLSAGELHKEGTKSYTLCSSHSNLQTWVMVNADFNSEALEQESSITVKDMFLNLNYPGTSSEKDHENF